MLKRRIRTLAVTGITGITMAAAALVALSTTSAPAASPAAASRVTDASATAAHAQGVVHVIQRGLVKDCVEIEVGNTGLQIWDNGPGRLVTLKPAPESCWNLVNKSWAYFGSQKYYGAEYQDLRGDCLWDDGGYITTAAGACQGGKSYQTWFGIGYYHNGHNAPGWIFTDAYYGLRAHMATDYYAYPNDAVYMLAPNAQDSQFWNFP